VEYRWTHEKFDTLNMGLLSPLSLCSWSFGRFD
jgi:hypothetical protein